MQLFGNGSDRPEYRLQLRDPLGCTVGELERVPIQITALARFRPRASFNPYFGAGIGYSILGFDPDPAFDELSLNMDQSTRACSCG